MIVDARQNGAHLYWCRADPSGPWPAPVTGRSRVSRRFVVGVNAHAVDNVSVYGFGEFCETSVFVEHICVSVEATIVGEDRFHWRLLNLGVQSGVVEEVGITVW